MFHINFSKLSNCDQPAIGLLAILVNTEWSGEGRTRSMRIVWERHPTQEEETMNTDQLKGKWMQFKGELKQRYGQFIDDDLQQIEGNYDKYNGKVQERYGDKKEKDELMKWADQCYLQGGSAMKKFIGPFVLAMILGAVMITLSYAAGDMVAPTTQTVNGNLLKIDGEIYMVKDNAGREIHLYADKTTALDSAIKFGDKVEAQVTEKTHAVSMKHGLPKM
jgi:uncharacterized protein YjbJ (UPF0337 family)